MIRLSERLSAIASMCEECKDSGTLADVGCDHAYIPIYLLQRGIIHYAVAMDIKRGPLENAADNAVREGMGSMMSFVLSDGLEKLPERNDYGTLLIAGMGGDLMQRIISEGRNNVRRFRSFVFCPHSKIPDFRRFLGAGGFRINNEEIVFADGKFYTVIKAGFGSDICNDDFDYEFGPFFDRNSNDRYREAVLRHMNRLSAILEDNGPMPDKRRNQLCQERELYIEALRRFDIC